MNKALSQAQINRLLKQEPVRHTPKWPSDEDLMTLAKAVKAEEEVVRFSDGKLFTIRHDTKWDAIFIKPADGSFMPCGYFDRKKLKEVLRGVAQ